MSKISRRLNYNETSACEDYFELCPVVKKFKCKVCDSMFSGKRSTGNHRRHLINQHREIAEKLGIVEHSDDSEIENQPKKVKPVLIRIDKSIFVNGCVKMVALGNVSLNFFDSEGARDVFGPIESSVKAKINSANIRTKIKETAQKFRNFIATELKDRLFCLKIDGAMRLGKHILGINCQYLNGKDTIVRTLGMIEQFERSTAEHNKNEIENVLLNFGLPLHQVHECTTDNAANMIKAMDELGADQIFEFEELFVRTYNESESSTVEENESEMAENSFFEALESDLSKFGLRGMRCGQHTFQLAIKDVTKKTPYSENLKEVRKIVKTLKKMPYIKAFNTTTKPILDVVTRWNSTYKMNSWMQKHKDIICSLFEESPDLQVSDKIWEFIENFVKVFKSAAETTDKLEAGNLTMGDLYLNWLECEITVEEDVLDGGELKTDFLEALKNRRKILFESQSFLAAIYMDPRINFLYSGYISAENRKIAEVICSQNIY